MPLRVVERLHLGRLVTPLPDRHLPVYGWFQAKESFSRGLIFLLAKTWGLEREDLVIDPFCGTGTTLLACREMEIDSVGYDVHPLMLFASRVKLGEYDVGDLVARVDSLLSSRYRDVEEEVPGIVSRSFPPGVLKDLLFLRDEISAVDDERIRDFMKMGLMLASMRCSWAAKDGAAIRILRRRVPPLRQELGSQLRRMISDLKRMHLTGARAEVRKGDARTLKVEAEIADAVITSPPYLRKGEYLHAYRIEEWVTGVGPPDEKEILGLRPVTSSGDMPPEAASYFEDMRLAIENIHRMLMNGGRACLVVSDACFPTGVQEVCEPLCRMAQDAGFAVRQVVVVNRRYCTTPSRKKLGRTKEALLIWEK